MTKQINLDVLNMAAIAGESHDKIVDLEVAFGLLTYEQGEEKKKHYAEFKRLIEDNT